MSEKQHEVYEMLWDCKFCGTTKLLGKSQRFCPVCGAAQDPKTRYFPSDEEKVAVKDHKFVGADLICGSCAGTNSGNSEYCTQCGAPLASAARAGSLGAREARDGEKFLTSAARDLAKEEMDTDLARAKAADDSAGSKARRPFIIGGVVVVIVAVIGAALFLFSTTSNNVIVTGHSWERVINIEDYGPRSGSDWDESVPGDAYNVTCRHEQRDTRQVADGEECKNVQVDQGDGTFRQERQCTTKYRDEPVYDDKCSYMVDRWEYERNVTTTGASLSDAPVWPEANITNSGQCRGCEREQANGRVEKYIVFLKNTKNDTAYQCEFSDQTQWASMGVETVWTMDVRRTGSPVCDSLKKAS